MKTKVLCFVGLTASLFAYPAVAHHSFAMFDNSQTLTLSGTISEYEWRNPHCWLHMNVTNEAGQSVIWSFEMGSVNQLVRDGWTQETLAEGDSVEIQFHPLKDGSNGGQLRYAKLGSGDTLCQGNHCGAGADG